MPQKCLSAKARLMRVRGRCTGTVAKKDLSERDIQIIADLFRQQRPHQIYAAGDLSDPHGTHRTCLKVSLSCLHNSDHKTSDCVQEASRSARTDAFAIELILSRLLYRQRST